MDVASLEECGKERVRNVHCERATHHENENTTTSYGEGRRNPLRRSHTYGALGYHPRTTCCTVIVHADGTIVTQEDMNQASLKDAMIDDSPISSDMSAMCQAFVC
jgi:hypothetical protein